jgi:peptidoglycan/xylan/chitin deacetylase (PgdA/CDA1 family)
MYPLILAFHKIIPDEYSRHPYFWDALCTPYTTFVSLIESLYQENFAFISLQELEYAMMNPKERTVLLTFDDGYYNNVMYAYPFLKAENIPFLIALNGKCIEYNIWQWFDKVWYYGIKTQKTTIEIITQIQQLKYDIPALERWLSQYSDVSHSAETRIFFDVASAEELKTLQNVSFISHTYSHYIVTALSEIGLKQELSQNLDFFTKNNLKIENTYFAPPNGTKKDFNTHTTNILTETGVEYLFSMLPYTHHTRILPRYTPVHDTWKKEKNKYAQQRLLYKWFK